MKEREYVCNYKHCLHHGEKIKGSEAVMIGKKRYHWDCAATKQEIDECISLYMDCIDDKTQYPVAARIINNLVFKSQVPISYIRNSISKSKTYYALKPVQILYGIRKLFWTKEFRS